MQNISKFVASFLLLILWSLNQDDGHGDFSWIRKPAVWGCLHGPLNWSEYGICQVRRRLPNPGSADLVS